MMSGQPCHFFATDLMFRGIDLKSFRFSNWFAQADNRDKGRSHTPT
jgi:hypothetical protein